MSKRIPRLTYRIRCTAPGTSARGEYTVGPIRGQGAAEMRAVANYLADCAQELPFGTAPLLEDVVTETLEAT